MHHVSWFEIPTVDIDRSQQFYEAIFDTKLIMMDNPAIKMRMFPAADMMNDTTGALVTTLIFTNLREQQVV